MIVSDSVITFRPLQSADLPLLTLWMNMPHVRRWWNQAWSLEDVQTRYAPRIAGHEPTSVFIAEIEGRPFGWIQWYRWSDYPEHAVQLGAAPHEAGIDLGIGDPQAVGHGLGTRMIIGFVEQVVFADKHVNACVTDPEEANEASCRAFAKAGFQTVGRIRLQGEDHWRLVVRRAKCVGIQPNNDTHS